jgi:hypothetical protein
VPCSHARPCERGRLHPEAAAPGGTRMLTGYGRGRMRGASLCAISAASLPERGGIHFNGFAGASPPRPAPNRRRSVRMRRARPRPRLRFAMPLRAARRLDVGPPSVCQSASCACTVRPSSRDRAPIVTRVCRQRPTHFAVGLLSLCVSRSPRRRRCGVHVDRRVARVDRRGRRACGAHRPAGRTGDCHGGGARGRLLSR